MRKGARAGRTSRFLSLLTEARRCARTFPKPTFATVLAKAQHAFRPMLLYHGCWPKPGPRLTNAPKPIFAVAGPSPCRPMRTHLLYPCYLPKPKADKRALANVHTFFLKELGTNQRTNESKQASKERAYGPTNRPTASQAGRQTETDRQKKQGNKKSRKEANEGTNERTEQT